MLSSLHHFDETLPLDNDNECFKQAAKLLAKIKPDWNTLNIKYTFFTNGITNKIFCCTEKKLKEKIIFRVYGLKTELLIDRKLELINWQKLSSCGCAAPLHATFNNGIMCGYQPGKVLSLSTVRDATISKKIARAIANMHRLASRDKNEGNGQAQPCLLRKLYEYIGNMPSKFDDADKQKKFEQFPSRDRLLSEYADLEATIAAVNPEVVFCHNDLHPFNILYDKDTGLVSFIDYEYADFNYQACDIGTHFCEYAGLENADFSLYPSREYQLVWLVNYLKCFLERTPSEKEIEQLYIQVNICAAAVRFLWSVWGIIQARYSTVDFDFLSYAIARNAEYLNLKRQFFHLQPPS